MFQVQDIMTTNVVTVTPKATLRDAASLILRHGISGLPVVDDQDQLVGVLSEWDLLEVLESPEIESDLVGDYMTPNPVCVNEETSLVDVVDLFQTRRVRRLPVTRDMFLVGVVSRHDLIRFVLTTRDRIAGRNGIATPEESPASSSKPQKRKSAGEGKRTSSSMFA
jgi:CBS domain-containing protein